MGPKKDQETAGVDAANDDAAAEDRRAFLSSAGKFALLVPPAMTFLLSTTLASDAIARSGRCSGSDGGRHSGGGCDGDDDDHDGDHGDDDDDDGDYRRNNANTRDR